MDNKDNKPTPKAPEPCRHLRTYIAVRHESGISLRKCSDCGRRV